MPKSFNARSLARRTAVIAAHVGLWVCAFLGAYTLRFEGAIPPEWRPKMGLGLAILLVTRIAIFWWVGLFHGMMRYAGIPEIRSIVQATSASSLILVLSGVLYRPVLQPRSVYFAEWVLAILVASSLRLGVRVVRERKKDTAEVSSRGEACILIGAGDAGEGLLRDLARSPNPPLRVLAIVDDDPLKRGSLVRGIPVHGPVNDVTLRRLSEDIAAHVAVLAIPTAIGSRTREILEHCQRAGLEVKTLPSFQQILNGDVRVSMLRDVAIEDLLRREPVRLDEASMGALLRRQRVLVTGGAGSIGSELARQAAAYEPAALVLFDHNENGLFHLERELRAKFPVLNVVCAVGDVKDVRRVSSVLSTMNPQVVLHAAAHKHVPMMEANPSEAVKNNVFGTKILAELSGAYGVETFVLISTDKAVNPTSVMGTTKRLAEMCVQSLSQRSRTRYVTVRFGNVLGSEGSVVPIFRQQIAEGGPVTVTHEDMTRYFMTIPEASQLVLQAAALAKGGEVLLLDMGEPVKIADLARDMIRLSGLVPDLDIKIVYTGQRPGEKLYEELFHGGEEHARTVHPKIFVGRTTGVDLDKFQESLATLRGVLDSPPEQIRAALQRLVPTARLSSTPPAPDGVRSAVENLEALETLLT